MSTSRSGAALAAERGGRSPGAERCRRKFLRFFPGGFRDETYVEWERGYKWQAHERWDAELGPAEFRALLAHREYDEVAMRAFAFLTFVAS